MIEFLDDLADLVAAIVFLILNVGVVVVIGVIILGIVFDSDGSDEDSCSDAGLTRDHPTGSVTE